VSPPRANRPSAARAAAAPSDGEIMARLASGDTGALGELYDRYHQNTRRFIARATAEAEDVDDLVHATFLAAATSAARYDGRDSARPWLIGIAVQHLRRRRQTSGRFFAALRRLAGARTADVDPDRATTAITARGDIERALRGLSEAKRVTLLMAEVEEMSCPEIAAILQIPIGTVWTRLHAARRELRQALGDDR
jgi:RNA polymerase sigma factor (sigma-70 family)